MVSTPEKKNLKAKKTENEKMGFDLMFALILSVYTISVWIYLSVKRKDE